MFNKIGLCTKQYSCGKKLSPGQSNQKHMSHAIVQGGLTLYQKTKFYTGPNSKHLQTTKINATENFLFAVGTVENMERGEMLVTNIFLFFHNVSQRVLLQGP